MSRQVMKSLIDVIANIDLHQNWMAAKVCVPLQNSVCLIAFLMSNLGSLHVQR